MNRKVRVKDHLISVNDDGTETRHDQPTGVVIGHRLKVGKWEIGVKFWINGVKIIGLYPSEIELI